MVAGNRRTADTVAAGTVMHQRGIAGRKHPACRTTACADQFSHFSSMRKASALPRRWNRGRCFPRACALRTEEGMDMEMTQCALLNQISEYQFVCVELNCISTRTRRMKRARRLPVLTAKCCSRLIGSSTRGIWPAERISGHFAHGNRLLCLLGMALGIGGTPMWIYQKKLEYPVNITSPESRMAKALMAQ